MTKNVVAATKQYYDNSGSWKTSEATPSADTITFTGTGFGSHDLDFEFIGGPTGHLETASVGNDSNFGSWIIDSNAQVSIVDDSERGQCWYAAVNTGTSNAAPMRFDRGSGNEIPANDKVYISWRTKRTKNAGDGQWKMFRMSWHNDIQDSGTEWTMFDRTDQHTMDIRAGLDKDGEGTIVYGGGNSFPTTNDKWYRMEMLIDTSTEGTKDGNGAVWRHDNVGVPTLGSFNYSQESTPKYPAALTYNTALRYRWFLWQNYRGTGLTDLDVWMDDAYIQVGTFRRVELCNNATYALATVREIQRIKSYSDTQVKVDEINPGGFGPGTYYAHLIDESGASIAMKSVVI